MTIKLYCPACGRFLGECECSDDTGTCKATLKKPNKSRDRSFCLTNKCKGCKSDIYVQLGFTDIEPSIKTCPLN